MGGQNALSRAPVQHSYAERPPPRIAVAPFALSDILSEREEQVARLVALGLSNKEIGQRLAISHWTVSTYLRRLFVKLEITRRIELCNLVNHASRSAQRRNRASADR